MKKKIYTMLEKANRFRLDDGFPMLLLEYSNGKYVLEEKQTNCGIYYIDAIGLKNIYSFLQTQIEWYEGM